MQIYECCCHIQQLNEPEDDNDKATTVTLVENYQLIANQYYAKKIEVYSFMIEKVKLQSKNSQNLSEFPSIDQWTAST